MKQSCQNKFDPSATRPNTGVRYKSFFVTDM
jgi:hypothetical protein